MMMMIMIMTHAKEGGAPRDSEKLPKAVETPTWCNQWIQTVSTQARQYYIAYYYYYDYYSIGLLLL